MATGKIGIGDLVAMTATVRRRVDEDTVSVSIPSYNFSHSIYDSPKVKRGQQIELTGKATRIDEDSVTIALGPHRQGAAGREPAADAQVASPHMVY